MTTPIVLSLGELLWDMLPSGKRAGGAPVNFAYHAMKNGTEGWAISAVGEDELGDELIAKADEAGINTVLQRNAWPTSTVEVALKNGIPEYTIVKGVAWDHILYTASSSTWSPRPTPSASAPWPCALPNRTPPSRSCSSTPSRAR